MNNKTIELHTIATFQGKEYELEDLLNGLLNKLEEKDKEIERLSKEVDMWNRKYNEQIDIINELEKWLEENIKISKAHDNQLGVNVCNTFLNKLKALKEGK